MTDSGIRAQSDLHRQITWNLFPKTGNAGSPFPLSSCALCCLLWLQKEQLVSLFTGPIEYLWANAKQKSLKSNPNTHPRRAQSHTSNFWLLQELEFGFLSSSVHVGESSIFSMF